MNQGFLEEKNVDCTSGKYKVSLEQFVPESINVLKTNGVMPKKTWEGS